MTDDKKNQKRGRGRPAIDDMRMMQVRFPAAMLDRIDDLLVGKEKRAEFIRAAIDREIARRQSQK